jgi:hypothetical protein
MLKQYIWDSFWVALELNHASAPFKILVKLAPHRDNLALPRGPAATKQTSMNATTSALPAVRFTTSRLGNVGVVAHSRSPAVTIPKMYDGCPPHDIEVTTRQSAFAIPPPRPNNNATAPQIQFPPVQTTQFPEHGESSMESSPQIHGAMDVAAYVPRQHQ